MSRVRSSTPSPRWNEADDMRFREMWAQGVAMAEIALQLGRTFNSIQQRRLILDLPVRRQPRPENVSRDKRKEGYRPRRKVSPVVRLLNPNRRGYFNSAAVMEHILNARRAA